MRSPPWVRALAALGALRLVFAAIVPVTPEEAYHWNFGRHLDWSYYDHPGMIAWAIRLGGVLFGDTALGIRFVPILFALGTTAVVARLARRLYGEAAAGWAVLLVSIEPITFLASGGGYPDSPLLFFWALAMTFVFNALESGKGPWWIAAGLALGGSGLSKYTGAFFGLAVLLHLVSSARDRRWLVTPWPYLACVVALAALWPVFHWNAAHGWASFEFQGKERLKDSHGLSPKAAGMYLLSQWGGVVPLTLPLAAVALPRAWRSERPAERYLFWCFVPMVAFFFLVACFRYVHLMWPLPAYLSLTVLMAGQMAKAEGKIAGFYARRWRWPAGVAAVALVGGVIHLAVFLPWLSPVQGMYGWDRAAARAKEIRVGMSEGTFYLGLGRKYVCPSQLAFRLRAPLEVHGKNLVGEMGSQYDYWADPKALAGRDAVVVLEDGDRTPSAIEQIRSAFATVENMGHLVVPVGRTMIRREAPPKFLFFRARGYIPPKAR